MSIVISRSESQLSATSSFQALDNLAGASVSSSFTVPTGVTAIKQLTISVTADGAEEFVPLVKVSGNSMRDGDAVFAGAPVMGAIAMTELQYDTDLAVQPGNSCEFSIAVTDAAVISAVVTAQFA
jgi:hypothetical protein